MAFVLSCGVRQQQIDYLRGGCGGDGAPGLGGWGTGLGLLGLGGAVGVGLGTGTPGRGGLGDGGSGLGLACSTIILLADISLFRLVDFVVSEPNHTNMYNICQEGIGPHLRSSLYFLSSNPRPSRIVPELFRLLFHSPAGHGVILWGQMRIPEDVRNIADEIVGWQTASIVSAIRRCAI